MIIYKPKYAIRAFIIILLVAAGFLFYLDRRPVRVYYEDFKGLRSPISGPFNANQLKFTKKFKDRALVMDKNQFYFNVFLNEVFDKAVFKIKFQNENHTQFNLKVPVDKDIADAVSYPLEQKKIDILKSSLDWIYFQDKSTVFLQRRENRKLYGSIDEFLRDMPITKKDRGIVAEFGDYRFAKNVNISYTQIVPLSKIADFGKIDYVIGRYEPWVEEGEWKTNKYELVIPELFRRKGAVFPLFVEAIDLESKQHEIIIDSVEIVLEKPGTPLSKKVTLFFRQFSFVQ